MDLGAGKGLIWLSDEDEIKGGVRKKNHWREE